MQRWKAIVLGGGLLATGYVLGAIGALDLRAAIAQQETEGGVSKETAAKIRAANNALRDAADALRTEGRYRSVTEDVNSFLVLAGGGNAREDLESGTGVDPETFAALYGGRAIPEIADLLEYDDENRLTYNGQVVRMYSKARLQRMFAERTRLAESRL